MRRDLSRTVWWLIAVMAGLTVVSFAFGGLTVAPLSNPPLVLVCGAVLGASCFYRTVRPDPHLQAIAESTAQILLILLFGILLTYAAVTADFPYVDADLYSIDNALGFDRRAYLDFFARRPWLGEMVKVAYFSMLPQFALVPVVLFISNQLERLQQMNIAMAVALLITVLVSVFTPSLTAFVYVDLPHVAHLPAGLYTPEATMEALRAGTFHTVQLNNLEGLVSFPSFHTAAALIFIWVLRNVPYLRWAVLALNLALISATPIDGAHYSIDIIGGVVVAAMAIGASHWLCRRSRSAAPVASATVATTAAVRRGAVRQPEVFSSASADAGQ